VGHGCDSAHEPVSKPSRNKCANVFCLVRILALVEFASCVAWIAIQVGCNRNTMAEALVRLQDQLLQVCGIFCARGADGDDGCVQRGWGESWVALREGWGFP
jgi:hypothetical protein